jgi:hypothetical protein
MTKSATSTKTGTNERVIQEKARRYFGGEAREVRKVAGEADTWIYHTGTWSSREVILHTPILKKC